MHDMNPLSHSRIQTPPAALVVTQLLCRLETGSVFYLQSPLQPPVWDTMPGLFRAPRVQGTGLTHLSAQMHTHRCWHCYRPSGGWAGLLPPLHPALASWGHWAFRSANPHQGSRGDCATGGGGKHKLHTQANRKAEQSQEPAFGEEAHLDEGHRMRALRQGMRLHSPSGHQLAERCHSAGG